MKESSTLRRRQQAVRLGGRHNMPPPLLTVGQRVNQRVMNPSIAQGSCDARSIDGGG